VRISYYVSERGTTVDEIVAATKNAAEHGFPAAWASDGGSWDALTVLAAVGRDVPGIELATGVAVSHSRHPLTMAAQALTVQSATGNRLTLGIGVSHQYVVEGQFGYSFDRPARHLREYLSALTPLLYGETVDFQGETLRAVGGLLAPGAQPPSVLVGALGPAMLRVAGELADGTVTVWAGPHAIAEFVAPTVGKAAVGRATPRIVAGALVAVTSEVDAVRAAIDERYASVGDVPHYRAIFDREGVSGPGEAAIIGDEKEVRRRIQRLFNAGATEFLALPAGSAPDKPRTIELLASLAKES
jgi:F420-dependent oxidoreductase-like protein